MQAQHQDKRHNPDQDFAELEYGSAAGAGAPRAATSPRMDAASPISTVVFVVIIF